MKELDAALLASAERAFNLYIDQRTLTKARLSDLAGQRIRLEVLDKPWSIDLLFTEDRVLLSTSTETPADACIRGQLGDLLQLLYQPRAVLFGQGVALEGDITLVQRLQKAFADPELDWEEWLAARLGDLNASALLGAQHNLNRWAEQTGSSLIHSLKDYLQEETGLLPSRIEFEIWERASEQLGGRTEQLNRRVQALSERLDHHKDQDRHED